VETLFRSPEFMTRTGCPTPTPATSAEIRVGLFDFQGTKSKHAPNKLHSGRSPHGPRLRILFPHRLIRILDAELVDHLLQIQREAR